MNLLLCTDLTLLTVGRLPNFSPNLPKLSTFKKKRTTHTHTNIPDCSAYQISNCVINPNLFLRCYTEDEYCGDLAVVFDSSLSLDKHFKTLCAVLLYSSQKKYPRLKSPPLKKPCKLLVHASVKTQTRLI